MNSKELEDAIDELRDKRCLINGILVILEHPDFNSVIKEAAIDVAKDWLLVIGRKVPKKKVE